MDARGFIARCRTEGIALSADGDRLIVDLPPRWDRPAFGEWIAKRKAEILRLLAEEAPPIDADLAALMPPGEAWGFSKLAPAMHSRGGHTADEVRAALVRWVEEGRARNFGDMFQGLPLPVASGVTNVTPETPADPGELSDPFEGDPENADLLYLRQMLADAQAGTLPPGPAVTDAGTFADPGAALLDAWQRAYEAKQDGDLDGAAALAGTLTALLDWYHDSRLQVHTPGRDGITVAEAIRRLRQLHPPEVADDLIARLDSREATEPAPTLFSVAPARPPERPARLPRRRRGSALPQEKEIGHARQ